MLTATYIYDDDRGRPRLRKLRRDPKGFQMQAARYVNDRLYWKTEPGCVERWQPDWGPRALFNLPVLLDALGYGEDVTLVEGEKDALTLNTLWGTAATTSWQGASAFTTEQAEWFLRSRRGSRINIIRDADDAGAYAALERYTRLVEVGVPRRRLRLWAPVGAKDITEAALGGLSRNAVRRESPGDVKELAFREGARLAARGYLRAGDVKRHEPARRQEPRRCSAGVQ